MQYYDLNGGGSLSYKHFLKLILPCDDNDLREEASQRRTYRIDVKKDKKLHPAVEAMMLQFFAREAHLHIKIEMLKYALQLCPDWNTKDAYRLIDSQNQGYISHPQIFAFLFANGHDASDRELIAIIRRIDGNGNGALTYYEFCLMVEPIILRMTDIMEVED